MESALKLIFDLVIRVFVPLLLIIAIFLLNHLWRAMENKKYQASARAGFWAGFMLFVIILIYQVGIFLKTGFPNDPLFRGFNIWLALGGGMAAFIFSYGGKKIIPPKYSGWVVLTITFACFYALFHYLFIRTFNEIILSLTLGITFGILAHISSSPALIHEFFAFLRSKD